MISRFNIHCLLQVLACVQPIPLEEAVAVAAAARGNGMTKSSPLLPPPSALSAISQPQPTNTGGVMQIQFVRQQSPSPSTSTSSSPAPPPAASTPRLAEDEAAEAERTPLRPFACKHPGCNRSFDKANLLKRHEKLHSIDCKYVCDVCKKCFEVRLPSRSHCLSLTIRSILKLFR